MLTNSIRFDFGCGVPMRDAEGTLRLALLAVESLVGADRVRLEAHFSIDREGRCIVIDTTAKPGRLLALVFSGYARREFGCNAVAVEHLCMSLPEVPQDAHA